MPNKARELQSNPQRDQAYVKPDLRGRVTHSDVWARTLRRWKPGTRVFVTFEETSR